jgi:hypothetical protein
MKRTEKLDFVNQPSGLLAGNSAKQDVTPDTADRAHLDALQAGKECLDEALRRLGMGWSALALCPPDHVGVGRVHGKTCKSPGKRPWHPWKEFEERLPTEDEIRDWWRFIPTSNLGLALGPVSGVVRLDVDGEAAAHQLMELSGGDLPATPEFRSGRADGTGRGILYAIPVGVVFRTTPHYFQDGELRFQAKGAQTVLPPSRHKDGGRYVWLPGLSPDEVPLAPAPPWVIRRWGTGPEGDRRLRPKLSPVETGVTELQGITLALAALAHLAPERAAGYDSWLRVGMALHAVSDAEELLNAWDEWSKQSEEKYEPGACAAKWTTFSADGGLQLGHLLRWAYRDSGWMPAPALKQPQSFKRTVLRCQVEVR